MLVMKVFKSSADLPDPEPNSSQGRANGGVEISIRTSRAFTPKLCPAEGQNESHRFDWISQDILENRCKLGAVKRIEGGNDELSEFSAWDSTFRPTSHWMMEVHTYYVNDAGFEA
jgi:hypothetical protein